MRQWVPLSLRAAFDLWERLGGFLRIPGHVIPNRVLPILVFMGLLVLAGCTVFDHPTRDSQAEAALGQTINAVEATESYRFNSELTITEGIDKTDVTLDGVVNIDAETMHANISKGDETRETYLVEKTLYQRCPPPWNDSWAAKELDYDEAWWRATPLGTQLELFETGDLFYNGTTEMAGTDVIILRGTPTTVNFGGTTGPIVNLDGPSIDDITGELRIDAATHLPIGVHIVMELSDGDETATVTMVSEFTAFDEPTDISLPAVETDGLFRTCPPGW